MKQLTVLLRMSWRNLWRQRKRTGATVAAVSVSVTMILVSISLQQGMIHRMFSLMVERQTGHIQLHHRDYPRQHSLHDTVPRGEEIANRLRHLPQVREAAVRIYAFGLLATDEDALGMQLLGLDLNHEQSLGNWSHRIFAGELPNSPQSAHILLGHETAKRLSLNVGDKVVILAQAADGSLANRLFEVSGLYRSGIKVLDARTVIFPRRSLQDLLALPPGGHEIAIQLNKQEETDHFALHLRRSLFGGNRIWIRTWDELNPTAARLLGLQRIGTWIVVGIVFGVAALTILNTMLMGVLERVHEFGVLYAIGLRPSQIAALVFTETFMLTTLGAGLGGTLTIPIQIWLTHYGLRLSSESSFSMTGISFDSVLHGRLTLTDAFSIIPALYLLTAMTALWPAIQAARVPPIYALRHA